MVETSTGNVGRTHSEEDTENLETEMKEIADVQETKQKDNRITKRKNCVFYNDFEDKILGFQFAEECNH